MRNSNVQQKIKETLGAVRVKLHGKPQHQPHMEPKQSFYKNERSSK